MNNEKDPFSNNCSKTFAFFSLIFIFTLLILHQAISLFIVVDFDDIEQIDVVFRTAISSIFGYLISIVASGDYKIAKNKKIKGNEIGEIKALIIEPNSAKTAAEIIETDSRKTSVQTREPEEKTQLPTERILRTTQVSVLSGVCIFCLITLLIVRNFSNYIVPSSTNIVTISLFRDIISGSIGALIGLSKS